MTAYFSPERVAALVIVLLASRERLLGLDARRRIFQHVASYPGLHLAEVARGTGMVVNHVKYHLARLERHGLVSSRDEDGYLRFWPREEGRLGPTEAVAPEDKRVIALLRRPVPLRIILELLEHDASTQVALVGTIGVAQSTLSYHLGRLVKAGVVTVEPAGRERTYRLRESAAVLSLLVRYRPPDRLVAGFLEAWESLEI